MFWPKTNRDLTGKRVATDALDGDDDEQEQERQWRRQSSNSQRAAAPALHDEFVNPSLAHITTQDVPVIFFSLAHAKDQKRKIIIKADISEKEACGM